MKIKFYFKFIFITLSIIGVVFMVKKNFFQAERELNIATPFPVKVVWDGYVYQTISESFKVEDFLREKSIYIYSKDLISPDLKASLKPHSRIEITSNREVSIEVDGEVRGVSTTRRTIEEVLKDENIKLNPFDKIKPDLKDLTRNDLEVEITRIEKKNIIEEEVIEYETIVKEDKDLKWKKIKIKQEGEDGLKEVEYELVYKNGELVSKTKLSSKTTKEVQPKIVVEGRKIEIISIQRGRASWYAFTGEMKCASVRYPKGTWLRVTNQENGKQIIVQVNDYGPDPGTGKVIDLDKVAFAKLASIGQGVIEVKIEEIESG
jgi:uncharacterized protein YabE (DUF348 family)